jgi:hypothetical protein
MFDMTYDNFLLIQYVKFSLTNKIKKHLHLAKYLHTNNGLVW